MTEPSPSLTNKIKALLTRRFNVHVTPTWLAACIQHVVSEDVIPWHEENRILAAVYDQWLDVDIREPEIVARNPQKNFFPSRETLTQSLKTELPTGTYTVMVLNALNIAQSAFTQHQKIHKIKDENSRVSSDNDKNTYWEPKPNRMLRFQLTDGFETLEALEHKLIPKIKEDSIKPGMKLTLQGPIMVRRGVLFLTPEHVVKIHGGHVEDMDEAHSSIAILNRIINRSPNSGDSGIGSENGEIIRTEDRCSLPTQSYRPRGLPMVFRDPQKQQNKAKGKSKGKQFKKETGFEDEDDDDSFLAGIDMDDDISRQASHLERSINSGKMGNLVTDFKTAFKSEFKAEIKTEDDDDDFLADMEMPGDYGSVKQEKNGNSNTENGFGDDEDDDIFAEVEIPPAFSRSAQNKNKRMKRT